MKGGREKLERKAEQAIAALLTEPSHEAAAKKAGISPTTLQRWTRHPKFKAMFRAARRAVLERAIGLLQNGAVKAVEALTRNLTCGKPASEIRAAEVILTHAAKGLEMLDVIERVTELERLYAGMANDGQEQPEADRAATGGGPEGGDDPQAGEAEAGVCRPDDGPNPQPGDEGTPSGG